MLTKPLPPLELINEWLRYDPETGKIYWRRKTQGARGETAGYITLTGYVAIKCNAFGGGFLGHRLAWALHHQELPEVYEVIDHINGVKNDNRLVNLRLTSQSVNRLNSRRRSDNKSGHNGVYWCNTFKRWFATISISGKRTTLGRYHNLADAVAVRENALRQLGL